MRVRRLIGTISVLALLLAACGSEAEPDSAAVPDEAEETAAVDDAADVEADETDDGAVDESAADDAADAAAADEDALVIDGELIADGDLYQDAVEEGQLLLYTTYAPDAMEQVSARFTEDTGIEVEQVRLVSPQLFERIMSEFGAGILEADIVENNDPQLMEEMAEAGVMTGHRVPAWDAIPDELKRDDELFYNANQPLFAIAYNTELVSADEAPQTWEDLLDPRWEGNLGLSPIVTGVGWTTQLMLYDLGGEEYWEGLAAQNPVIHDSIVPIVEEMVRGEIAVSINHVGTVLLQKSRGAPVDMVFPPEGLSAPPHFAGVSSAASHPSAARVYMNWRMSQHGGQVFTDLNGDYSAHPDIEPPEIAGTQLPSPSEVDVFRPTLEDWTVRKDELGDQWFEIFGIAQ